MIKEKNMKFFNKQRKITDDDIIKSFKKIKMNKFQKILLKEFNYIFDNAIGNIINNKLEITVDEKIIIENICDSLNVVNMLIKKNNYIEALAIIRNIFEECLVCLAINSDDELYSSFIKFYQIRNKQERIMLKPASIRENASNIIKNFFKETNLNWYDWNKKFDEYYDWLCEIVHPSIFKNFIFSIFKEVDNNKNIEILIRTVELYTRFILLIVIKIMAKEDGDEKLYDLFFLLSSTMLMQLKNESIINDIIEKNYVYLHKDENEKILEKFDYNEKNDTSISYDNFEFILKFMIFLHVSGFSLSEINDASEKNF